MEGGLGEWHYPNGSAVGEESGLYVRRDQMTISLNRRENPVDVPSGVYCCVVPTTQGILASCIEIGILNATFIRLV